MYQYELKCRPTLASISNWSRGDDLKSCSQILFRHGRRWKTLTHAGYFPTAASLPLAQPFLLLLWLVIGAFPAWAQTGASLSGVVTDQTGAALRDVAVTVKNVDTGETRTIASDGGGHYQASALPLGRFEIRAA